MNPHLKPLPGRLHAWRTAASPAQVALTLCMVWLLAGWASSAHAESIARAQYDAPTRRYGHFALGQPHEYARLVVTTDTGRRLVLDLPEDEVFEDLAPRQVKLATHEPTELLTIVSHRQTGARLQLIRLSGDRLVPAAASEPVGTPMRWLNPVGVVDLDGDGLAEVASVTTPHIGGTLKVYQRQGARLEEVASLGGFSNHVYGSAELGLSAHHTVAGRVRLLVPDNSRRFLRIVEFTAGRLTETGRCALPAPVTGAVTPTSASEVSVHLTTGSHAVVHGKCGG